MLDIENLNVYAHNTYQFCVPLTKFQLLLMWFVAHEAFRIAWRMKMDSAEPVAIDMNNVDISFYGVIWEP